eukprot:3644277-Rhodomonas_salina.5
MPGTDLARGPICLLAPYEMSGTDPAYGAPTLLSSYALAMWCPVLTSRMVLPGSHQPSPPIKVSSAICLRACYAMPGTDLAYAATRASRTRAHGRT